MNQHEAETPQFGITSMRARKIVAQNLVALMGNSRSLGSAPKLEAKTKEQGNKVGKSTIDRAMKADTPLTLDNLEALAKAFELDAWQLLVPGLSPSNPPLLRQVGESEDQLYRRIESLVQEAAGLKSR